MQVLIGMILAALPNALMAIFGKLVTQAVLQQIIERVVIRVMKKAATMTTNTVDDEVVKIVTDKLQTPPQAGA